MDELQRTEHLDCQCGTHMLRVSYDPQDKWCSLNIAFWEHGHSRDGKTGIGRKLGIIKQVLKTGTPYEDMVILDPMSVHALVFFMAKYQDHALRALDAMAAKQPSNNDG